MKIYIGHSNEWNYEEKLYEPIINSKLYKEHEIIFPHQNGTSFNTEQTIEDSDLFIAEVSIPSLGLGIEIGRAEKMSKKILCIYQKEYQCPNSLKYVNVDIMKYDNEMDMVMKIENYINIIKGKNE